MKMSRQQLEQARSFRPQNFHQAAAWFRIKNIAADHAEVYIYDEIGYFGVTADDFIRDVSAINADNLTVRLNSKGGDVFEALALYAYLAEYPGTVTAIVDSVAASAASFLIAGADKIQIQRNASIMVHDASLTAFGNAATMRAAADLLDMASDNIADIYAQRSDSTAEEWRRIMQSGDAWYTATEAVAAGLADEVLDAGSKKTKEEPVTPEETDATDDLGDILQEIDLVAILETK